jgi:NTE family protein
MSFRQDLAAPRNARARPTLREWLAAEPFTLAMSSGFFGFFAHTGVLRVLEDEGLLPVRAAGSSAGALVTGCWCAGVSPCILAERLTALERAQFWDPAPGLGLLRGARFTALLDALLPVATFAECRVPLRVSVFDVAAGCTRVLQAGPLSPAIQASCTVPGMFQPVWLGGRPLVDGGVLDRPGLAGVQPTERVFYHHLTSRLPWRSARSLLKRDAPQRAGMLTLEIAELPRADPFHLERGLRAMDVASSAMRAALARPSTTFMSMEAS